MSTLVEWMGIVGIPSIFTIVMFVIRSLRKYAKKLEILMRAQQAQMRAELLKDYHQYLDQGWVSEDDLEDWENRYQAYHSLGKNGVLDERRKTLIALPNKVTSTSTFKFPDLGGEGNETT